MKRIIFRVDDRLIHGQVVEGWVKNFQISKIIVANNRIFYNNLQQMILSSAVPAGTSVVFSTVQEFANSGGGFEIEKNLLVLFESLPDFTLCEPLINDNVYINIGCLACRERSTALSDTVFLEPGELEYLLNLSEKWEVHIKKLPWEKDIILKRM